MSLLETVSWPPYDKDIRPDKIKVLGLFDAFVWYFHRRYKNLTKKHFMVLLERFYAMYIKEIKAYDTKCGYTDNPDGSFFFDRHIAQLMRVWELRVEESGDGSRNQYQPDSDEFQMRLRSISYMVDTSVDLLLTANRYILWVKDEMIQELWQTANLEACVKEIGADMHTPCLWTSTSNAVSELPDSQMGSVEWAFQLED